MTKLEMEKFDKMKDGPRAMMDNIAVDLVLSYENKNKFSARCHWYQLCGAARMYAVLADKDPNPVQTYALKVLGYVCETYGEDLSAVWDYLRK